MTLLLIGIGIAFVLLFIVVLIMAVGIYNSLIALKEHNKQAWANIDVILKQRFDEVPKLVKICQQYAQYEQKTIDKIMKARAAMVKGSHKKRMEASNALSLGISGLLAVGENYPELKANENFIQLQTRISDLEESLADRREYFNNAVNNYNVRIQQIPDVFIARFLGYAKESLFEVQEFEKQDVSVDMAL